MTKGVIYKMPRPGEPWNKKVMLSTIPEDGSCPCGCGAADATRIPHGQLLIFKVGRQTHAILAPAWMGWARTYAALKTLATK